jgi:hypothetical protein
MIDENTKLLEQLHHIIKELMFHARESNCQHRVQQLLDELEFENE